MYIPILLHATYTYTYNYMLNIVVADMQNVCQSAYCIYNSFKLLLKVSSVHLQKHTKFFLPVYRLNC